MFLDEARLAARLTHPNIVQTIEVGSEGRPSLHGHGVPRRALALPRLRRFREQGGLPRWVRTCASSATACSASTTRTSSSTSRPAARGRPSRRQPAQRVRDVRRASQGARLRDREVHRLVARDEDRHRSRAASRTWRRSRRGERGRPPRRRVLGRRHDLGGCRGPPPLARHERRSRSSPEPCAKARRRCAACSPDVPQELDAICARAMEQKPDDRYATAQDLLEDLEAHLADATMR